MESGYKTKLTIATLLAGLSHWSPSVMADERFIFQPKHQQSTRDLPAIQPGDMATKTKLDRAPQLESVDSQLGPLISVLESQQPSQVDDLRSPPDVPSQSSGGKVLRWVARGGLSPRPDPTDSDQPPVDPSRGGQASCNCQTATGSTLLAN